MGGESVPTCEAELLGNASLSRRRRREALPRSISCTASQPSQTRRNKLAELDFIQQGCRRTLSTFMFFAGKASRSKDDGGVVQSGQSTRLGIASAARQHEASISSVESRHFQDSAVWSLSVRLVGVGRWLLGVDGLPWMIEEATMVVVKDRPCSSHDIGPTPSIFGGALLVAEWIK